MARWILWASTAVLVGVAVLGLAGNGGGKFVRCDLHGGVLQPLRPSVRNATVVGLMLVGWGCLVAHVLLCCSVLLFVFLFWIVLLVLLFLFRLSCSCLVVVLVGGVGGVDGCLLYTSDAADE